MAIIALSAKIGVGKDAVASMIQDLTKQVDKTYISTDEPKTYRNIWEVKKFAGHLKTIVSLFTGIPVADLEKQEVKSRELGEEWDREIGGEIQKYTVRLLLQKIGTEAMRDVIHENVWVNSLFANYKQKYNWIISDCRFFNEAEAVKKRGGWVVRIERPSIVSISTHPSETGLDDYQEWDYYIVNDGTLDDLKEKVKQMLKHFNVPFDESK